MSAKKYADLSFGQRAVFLLAWMWMLVLAGIVAAGAAGVLARLVVWAFRLGWGA